MRNLTFLLSFLLFVSTAHAYTLILKNGRRCSGELISDAGATLQLRDSATGAVLSVKRDQLDADATAAANPVSPVSAQGEPLLEAARHQSLAALAADLRRQRTGRARVYTPDDLKTAPEVSVSGALEPVTPEEGLAAETIGAPDERRWRNDARIARKDLQTAEDRAATAATACEQARNRSRSAIASTHRRPLELSPLTQEPVECRRMMEWNERLLQARDRYDDFQERARRAGIPWQWLE